VPGLNGADLDGVGGAGLETIERDAVFQVDDLHPGLDSAVDFLQLPVVHAVGDDLREAIQHLQRERRRVEIGERHLAHQRGDGLARQREVADRGLKAMRGADRLQLQFVHPNQHSGSVVGLPGRKGLVQDGLGGALHFDEGAEPRPGRGLIRFVRGLKFHDGVILAGDAETGDRLPPVHVEDPERRSKRSGNPRQEAGEGAPGGVILHDKAA